MNKLKRKKIHHIAESIRQTIDVKTPVDFEEVIPKIGGSLIYDHIEDKNGHEVDAKITKEGDSFVITINDNYSPTRNNFSVAHELGHLFLHMGYLIDEHLWNSIDEYSDSVYYRFGFSEEEFEANEFAAAFLMPEDELLEYIDNNSSNNTINISDLAHHFNVSKEAALNRGRWIGLFSWD